MSKDDDELFEEWYSANKGLMDPKKSIKDWIQLAFQGGQQSQIRLSMGETGSEENKLFDAWLETVGHYDKRQKPTMEQAQAIKEEVRRRVGNAARAMAVLVHSFGYDDRVFCKYPIPWHMYRIYDHLNDVIAWLKEAEAEKAQELTMPGEGDG